MSPKVSIIAPTYNHEAYVAQAIESTLQQSFQDFELLVVDDGSTDQTVAVIERFTDARIQLTKLPQNLGVAVASRVATQKARGDYIAFLSTDDLYQPDKLEKQVAYLEAHPEIAAVFTHVDLIDEGGQASLQLDHYLFQSFYLDATQIKPPIPQTNRFNQPNRTREEWLNHFFHNLNCLCAPSVMIRREVLESLNAEDFRLIKTSDFDLWVRLCLHHQIHMLEEPLFSFRIRNHQANSSAFKADETPLYDWEHVHILMNFLNLQSVSEFQRVFPDAETYGVLPTETKWVPFLVAMYGLQIGKRFNSATHRRFAMLALWDVFKSPGLAQEIINRTGITYKTLAQMMCEEDIFNIRTSQRLKQENKTLKQSV